MPSQIPEPQDQRMEDAEREEDLIDVASQRIRVVSHNDIGLELFCNVFKTSCLEQVILLLRSSLITKITRWATLCDI